MTNKKGGLKGGRNVGKTLSKLQQEKIVKINKLESDMHKRFDSKGDDLLNDALRQSIKRKTMSSKHMQNKGC